MPRARAFDPPSLALQGLLLLTLWGLPAALLPAGLGPGLRYLTLSLLRYALLGAALAREHRRWSDFYLTRRNLRPALSDGLVFALAFVPVAWLYARATLGGVYWLPPGELPATLAAALLLAALPEEVAYRGLFLGSLARMGAPVWAQVAVTSGLFAVQHVRYLLRGDPLTFTLVAAFGVVAAAMTLRRRNLAGAVLAHAAMNTLIFVFIGGRVSSL